MIKKLLRVLGVEQTDRVCPYCSEPIYESDYYMCGKELCYWKKEASNLEMEIGKLKEALATNNISIHSLMAAIGQYSDWNGTDPTKIYMSPDLHDMFLKHVTGHLEYEDGSNPKVFGLEVLPASVKKIGWYIE